MILAVLALLVVASLALVFTRGGSVILDPATPAGVVQAYSTAVIEGDRRAAEAYLTESGLARCDPLITSINDKVRVRLLTTDERADTARVRVLIVQSSGGPFGVSDYETEDTFDLVKVGGTWRIDIAPWQLMTCATKGASS